MAQGHFVISPTQDRKDIRSQIDPAVAGAPPDDQAMLLNEVDRTVRQLRLIFAKRDEDFSRYFNPLLSLAQGGLVGPSAQPRIAQRALAELKREVVDQE